MSLNRNKVLIIASDNKLRSLKKVINESFQDLNLFHSKNFENGIEFIMKFQIDLVVIDDELENIDSYTAIKRVKAINRKIAVILLKEDITKDDSLKALQHGVYNLVSLKTKKDNLLISIRGFFQRLQADKLNIEIVQFLQGSKIEYKIPNSLKYISVLSNHLTRDLAQVGLVSEDRLESIQYGVQEMLINAIEHGNLEIDFNKKSQMLENGEDIYSIVEKYAELPQYQNRVVTVQFELTKERATYVIIDEGNGFDWQKKNQENNEEALLLEHGRGIEISRKIFDKVEYNKKGNQVTLIVNKE